MSPSSLEVDSISSSDAITVSSTFYIEQFSISFSATESLQLWLPFFIYLFENLSIGTAVRVF
jgi:hypothetical protein